MYYHVCINHMHLLQFMWPVFSYLYVILIAPCYTSLQARIECRNPAIARCYTKKMLFLSCIRKSAWLCSILKLFVITIIVCNASVYEVMCSTLSAQFSERECFWTRLRQTQLRYRCLKRATMYIANAGFTFANNLMFYENNTLKCTAATLECHAWKRFF